MAASVIAREQEVSLLESIYSSKKPEFVAVYGRRRVGKTYLVKELFSRKKNCIFATITGMKDGALEEQIRHFLASIAEAFLPGTVKLEPQVKWTQAFCTLHDLINSVSEKKKIVLFFDELPWMATPNSKLLSTLEYFWNQYWSTKKNIKLIVCGSATSWILKNIVNNKDGLYNRITETLYVKPFTLKQTKFFMKKKATYLNDAQVLEIYSILGGIPFYLSKIMKKQSAIKTIGELGFRQNSFLLQEFDKLYATLFDDAQSYIDIVTILAKHHEGLDQENISKHLQIASGGSLTEKLTILEQSDFIIRLKSYSHRKKGFFYKLMDEYSLFYLRWLAPFKDSLSTNSLSPGYWEKKRLSPAGYNWAGYAFETICYKHIKELRRAFNLSETAIASAWRYTPRKNPNESGAQIDLLFDCEDGIILIIELKNTKNSYVFDKLQAENLLQKGKIFKTKTKTPKEILYGILSANKIKKTLYTEEIIHHMATGADLL